jgi:hypothetical protein
MAKEERWSGFGMNPGTLPLVKLFLLPVGDGPLGSNPVPNPNSAKKI